MINADKWMTELTEKLKIHFKNRLLFAGLQGSYRRQEAHENSDIDAVAEVLGGDIISRPFEFLNFHLIFFSFF